jgi:chromate reductase
MNALEAYIEFTPNLIDDTGKVTNEATETFLRNYMKEFCEFIERVYTAIPRTNQ